MAKKKVAVVFDDALAIEDFLGANHVFVQPDGGRGNMAAYMTILDYAALDACWAELIRTFRREQIDFALRMWDHWAYLSPIFSLTSSVFRRKLESKP